MNRKCRGTVRLALTVSLFAACGARDAFREDYEAVSSRAERVSLITDLLRLDQTYPDRLELKVDLGALYLVSGDIATARIYLEQGERRERRSRDRRLRAALHANLAQLELRAGEYERSVEHASTALGLDANDRIGVVFTRAKAYRALGREAEALEDCLSGWRESRSTMSREDFLACSEVFFGAERWAETLDVLRVFQSRFAYEPGIGLRESLLHEKLGRIEASVLAAFKELEYLRFAGKVTEEDLLARLEKLEDRLEDAGWNPAGAGIPLAQALARYVREDYTWAAAGLAALEEAAEEPFGRYLVLVCAMEDSGPDPASLLEYESLEPSLRSLGGYYYHLWRALRRDTEQYTARRAAPIVARGILLGPGTPFAAEARLELGRLAGMDSSDSRWILLDEEIQDIVRQVLGGADPAALDPLYRLAATPDNTYQLHATLALKSLAEVPAVRSAIAARSTTATGRLRERLEYVLGE